MSLQRVRKIFHLASEATGDARRAILAELCGSDAALRAQVESLLAAEASAGAFLAEPTMALEMPGDARGDEGPPPELGPQFRILEKLGEGGYGDVYLVEQSEPVRRKVAVKVLKAGMDSRQIVARFEAERQTLAAMDHPNIARVYDAGTTPGGRPYFVMEWVPGVPITEHCLVEGTPPEERLRLFAQVCRAVQHAHTKGVIHRDLKPSNILVARVDGRAEPKVIDFGIAKAMRGTGEASLHTELRHLIGTPAYMSPEQAALSGGAVDTRSDVYSLGVVLYELLTGVTPFDAAELRKAALAELQRRLAEDVPPKPSTRVTGLTGGLGSGAPPAGFPAPVRLLRGDLDWIVMKALEKEPGRRYGTASAMADDIARHLASEPVVARPPSRWYRLSKLARRNRTAFAAGAVALLALVVGLALALAGLVAARRESAARLTQQRKAETMAEVLDRALASANPLAAKGGDYTLRELLDDFAREFETAPSLDSEVTVALRQTLGRAYQSLGEYAAAEAQFRHALAAADATDGALGAAVNADLGWLLHAMGRYEKAKETLASALAELDPAGPEHALAEARLAVTLLRLGETPEALERARAAGARATDDLGGLAVLQHAANVLLEGGEVAEAVAAGQRALDLAERAGGAESPRTIEPLLTLARAWWLEGDVEAAETLGARARLRAEESLGPDHPVTLAVRGKIAEFHAGAAEHRDVYDALLRKLGAEHPETMEELIKLSISTLATAGGDPAAASSPSDSSTKLSELSGVGMTELVGRLKDSGRLAEFEVVVRKGMAEAAGRPGAERIALELECVYYWIKALRGEAEVAHRGFVALIEKITERVGPNDNLVVGSRLLWALTSTNHRPSVQRALAPLLEILARRPPTDFHALVYLSQTRDLHEKNFDWDSERRTIELGLRWLPEGGPLPVTYRLQALANRASSLRRMGATETAIDQVHRVLAEAGTLGVLHDKAMLATALGAAKLEATSDRWTATGDWLPKYLKGLPEGEARAALEELLREHEARLANAPETPAPAGASSPEFYRHLSEVLRTRGAATALPLAEQWQPGDALGAALRGLLLQRCAGLPDDGDFARWQPVVEEWWARGDAEARFGLAEIGRHFAAWDRGPQWRVLVAPLEDRRLALPAGDALVAADALWYGLAAPAPPPAWPALDGIDGTWRLVPAPFGTGEVAFCRASVAPETDAAGNKVCFSHLFHIENPKAWSRLKLRCLLAAAGTVYLNGREIHARPATAAEVLGLEAYFLPETLVLENAASLLRPGQNILSAELQPGDPARWAFDAVLEGLH